MRVSAGRAVPGGLVGDLDIRVYEAIEDALEWRDVRLAGEAAAGLQVTGVRQRAGRGHIGRAVVEIDDDQEPCAADLAAWPTATRLEVAGRGAAVVGHVSTDDRPASACRDGRVVLATRPADRRDPGAEIRERIAGIRQAVLGHPEIMRLLVRGTPELEPRVAIARRNEGHDRGERPPGAQENALRPPPRLERRIIEHAGIERPQHQRTALIGLPRPPARQQLQHGLKHVMLGRHLSGADRAGSHGDMKTVPLGVGALMRGHGLIEASWMKARKERQACRSASRAKGVDVTGAIGAKGTSISRNS